MSEQEEPGNSTRPVILIGALARGTGINLAGFGVRSLLVFTHGILAARLYGVEPYGMYTQGVAVVVLLGYLGQMGMDRTLTHYTSLYLARDERLNVERVLTRGLLIAGLGSLAIGALLGGAALWVAQLFGEPTLATPFRVFALGLPFFNVSALLAAFTQGFQSMRPKVVAIDVLRPSAELALTILFAALGWHRVGLPLAYVGAFATAGVALVVQTRRLLGTANIGAAGESVGVMGGTVTSTMLLQFAAPVLVMNLLQSATGRVNVLLLGALGTSAMVGVFSGVQRLASLGTTFLVSSNVMLAPMVSKLVERERIPELEDLYKTTARWSLIASAPIFLVMATLSRQFLSIFGPAFAVGGPALTILALTTVFNISTGSCGTVLMMAGYPRYSAVNELIKLALVIGIAYGTVPLWGLTGAAIATAAGVVIVNTLRVVQVWHHLRVHPFDWSLLKIAGAGAVLVGVLEGWKLAVFVQSGNLWVILPGVLAGGAAYVAIIVTTGFDPIDRELLHKLGSILLARFRTSLMSKGA